MPDSVLFKIATPGSQPPRVQQVDGDVLEITPLGAGAEAGNVNVDWVRCIGVFHLYTTHM